MRKKSIYIHGQGENKNKCGILFAERWLNELWKLVNII